MKTRKMYYSSESLKKLSITLALSSAMLCPATAMAAGNGSVAPSPQAVQQSGVVKGTVVDETGQPMIGVTIKVKGSQAATITDLDGNFSINASAGSAIEFSYIGYNTQTLKATGKSLSVKMTPDNKVMDEVVVIGYGTQKKRDLTGAVTSVKNDDITLSPTSNPMESLQGKVAGLDITKSSGQAGAGVDIQLRGTRSFTASGNPTVIIDGMPGNLSTLNPNDIESIDVLKDASSTAIYGSSGANGVIIVTTKSGKTGKATVNFNAYLGINGWSKTPKMRHGKSYFDVIKQAKIEAGNTDIKDEDVFDDPALYEDYLAGKDIDWADEVLKTGITQNYSLSVSGGTDKTKAYMSLNFTDEQGQYRDDDYKVYSTNMRIDHQLKKWMSIGVNMQGSYVHKNAAYSKLTNALRACPVGSVYDENGDLNITPSAGSNLINLLVNNKSNYRNNNDVARIYMNPYIRITPIKGLTFESRINASLSFNKANKFEGLGSYNYYDINGATATGTNTSVYASVAQTNAYSYKWENILTYNFKINDDHDFTITGVTSWNHNRQEYTFSQADSFTTNTYLYHNLGAGQNQQTKSSYTMSKGMGFVGRINYSYKGRYLASASVRHDGSSRLADGNRWDTFPAFSLGWRISDESFMESTKGWLDNLKVRVGYGVTGTAGIDPYSSISTLAQSYYGLGGIKLPSYYFDQTVANVNLGWEKSKSTNIGLDASFLNGRIDFTMDYYFTKTDDVIWKKNLPITNGGFNASTYYNTNMNICKTENRGIELALNTRNIVTKDFTWTSNLTFTHNKEKITKLATADADFVTNGNDGLVLMKGEPVNSYYHYKLNGTWKTSEAADAAVFGAKPGDLKIDIPGLIHDGEGQYSKWVERTNEETGEVERVLEHYDANNLYTPSDNDYQVLGHKNPDWTMGFKNTFTYKNFDLSVYLYWRWGQTIKYDMLGSYDPTGKNNFPTYFDYWTTETGNQNHYFPALNSGKDLSTYTGYYALQYVDGSFFKVKNITLGYTLPKKVAKGLGIENFRVYTTLTNPFVVANSKLLKDYDPEMGGSLNYPLTKQFVFGVNLTF